jgi:hypothetical protein
VKRISGSSGEGGVALVIGMVILVVLTLVVLSSVSMGTSNVKATSNMQFRDAALAAANVAVEQVVSSSFMASPNDAAIYVDLDQDGTNDYSVTVPAPSCSWWTPKLNSDLDPTKPEDLPCYSGSKGGGLGGGASQSFCADTRWDVRSRVDDAATGASVALNQGIGVRMSRIQAQDACK